MQTYLQSRVLSENSRNLAQFFKLNGLGPKVKVNIILSISRLNSSDEKKVQMSRSWNTIFLKSRNVKVRPCKAVTNNRSYTTTLFISWKTKNYFVVNPFLISSFISGCLSPSNQVWLYLSFQHYSQILTILTFSSTFQLKLREVFQPLFSKYWLYPLHFNFFLSIFTIFSILVFFTTFRL